MRRIREPLQSKAYKLHALLNVSNFYRLKYKISYNVNRFNSIYSITENTQKNDNVSYCPRTYAYTCIIAYSLIIASSHLLPVLRTSTSKVPFIYIIYLHHGFTHYQPKLK